MRTKELVKKIAEDEKLLELFVEFIKKDKLKKFYDYIEQKPIKLLDNNLPISIFKTKKISSLESIAKFLRENKGLSFKKIAKLLNRNPISLCSTYHKAKKKFTKRFIIKKTDELIPFSVFQNRKFSILESLIQYLKQDCKLSNHKIAILLNKDDRTIWTVYSRAKKKRSNAKRS